MRYSLNDISIGGGKYGGGFSAVPLDETMPRYLRITDIASDGTLNDEPKGPSGKPDSWKKYELQTGDLLFARSGATVGKTLLYDESMGPCVYAGYLIKFHINREIALPKYISYFTRSPQYDNWVSLKQNVVAQPNINAKQYGNELKINVPSLVKQQRIVKKLDLIDRLRQSLRAEVAAYGSLGEAVFLEMFGDPVLNEKNFLLKTVLEIVDENRPITYGILKPGENIRPDGVPYIKVVDFRGGIVNLKNICHTTEMISQNYKRSLLKEGDVLTSIRGHVGRTCVVPKELIGANITQDTARLAFNELVNSTYVQKCIDCVFYQRYMQRYVKGAAVKGVNLGDLKKFKVPIPPLPLQQKFAARIREIERLKAGAEAALLEADGLFGGVLGEVFG